MCHYWAPERPDADINYTMAQVDITQPILDFKGTAVNLFGVGPFAIDEGLVLSETGNVVRIYNTNTRRS